MISTSRLTAALAGCLAAATLPAQVNWSQTAVTGAPMAYGASAWDAARARLVAFGGEQSGTPSDQHREYDPVTAQWTALTPSPRPGPRRRPAMAYDEARGECVLFGGGSGALPGTFLSDTWTWNGTVWTQRSPAQSPSPRFGAALAYDRARQVVVLFGGFVPSATDIADVWEWNGTTWTPRPFAGGPSPRGAHRLVYDVARGVTVLYGGYSTPALITLADTWTWDGTSWTAGPAGPGSLCDQLFVYDEQRSRVVLFGGLRIQGGQTDLAATWEWNGVAWQQRTTATPPTARSSMACGYWPGAPGRVIAGGGAQNTGTQFGSTFAFAPTTPAATASFGLGCPTSGGPLALNALTYPYIGTDFVLQIANAPQFAAIGLMALGGSNTTWNGLPLPLDLAPVGAPGCPANVSPDVLLTLFINNGIATLTWALPNLPAVVGQTLYAQGIVLDPLSPLPFQIGVTPGRSFRFGAP
jgi:hypothetical protein